MKISELVSLANLQLAWRRITTGSNQQYKRFFRPLYYAYELAIDSNLKDLRQRIITGAWQPSSPDRIYVPKPSGLQRPITLLYIEDQIVLQAMANIIARKLFAKRRPFVLKQVFSNVLSRPHSIFFLKSWKTTYGAFQKTVRKQYEAGHHWVADFDLAAFYDTISHDLLLKTAYPRLSETNDINWVKTCLRTWSASKISSSRSHGLPQGPIASDFLAECFLLPIDRVMCTVSGYLRYVDDVRLLGRTESDVRRNMLRLEFQCRERGLIPQTGKFAIRRAASVAEALGMLPSINDSADDVSNSKISTGEALRLFQSALGGKPLRIEDKTRARYVLYRAEPSPRLLRLVTILTPRHPEHMDAFAAFLAQYPYRKPIRDLCLKLLKESPYNYVKGELWHILARFYRQPSKFDAKTRTALISEAVETLKSSETDTYLKWGAGHFVCVAEGNDGRHYSRFLNFQSPIVQALLAPVLPLTAFTSDGPAHHFLRRSSFEPALALAEALHRHDKTPMNLGIAENSLTSQARNVYARLGLVHAPAPRVDVIGEVIRRRYGVRSSGQWRRLLSSEYRHVAGILAQADAAYFSGPSHWLSMQILLTTQRF